MSVYSKQINYRWAPRGIRGALFMTGSICPCGWRRKRPIPPCALFWFTNAMQILLQFGENGVFYLVISAAVPCGSIRRRALHSGVDTRLYIF